MSKVEGIPELQPPSAAKRNCESKVEAMNGTPSNPSTAGPIYNPAASTVPRLIVDIEQGMEVDEGDDKEPAFLSGLTYLRSGGDRAARPSTTARKTPGAFDTVSISSTRSLYATDLEYYVENNRRYVPDYFMPNDEDEQLRLQILHQVYLSMLESKLTTAPLHRPLKILDVGTGTGEWAIGMAEHFPAADVTGIDLSAIQPTAVPPNVFFEIFDAEDDDVWTYPEDYFDLIHFRNMAGSFRSWDLMYERAYRHLKPGGWVEVVDFDDQEQCFFRFLGENSRAKEWYESITKASRQAGKEWSFTHLSTEKLARVGFQELDRTRHEVPIGTWPTDPKVRDIAKLWLVACLAGFEAYSLRLLTRDLGWSAQRVHQICQEIEKELKSFAMDKEKAKGMGIAITILLGQKPSAAWAGEMDMEADDERRSSKRVRTGAPSRDEKETPRAGDDADLRASQDMMQEMRRLLRRSGVSRSRMEQATNGAGAIPRGAGGDVDMGP